jgi:hypothetical protein
LDSEESKEYSNGDKSVCSTDDGLCDAFSNLMKKSESELRMSNLVSQMKRIRARNAQHRFNVERRRRLQLYFNGLRRENESKTTSEAAPKTGGDNSPESIAPTESREAKRARIRQRAQELKRLNPQAIHSMGRCSDALWVEMYDGYVHLETKSSPQTTSPSSKSSKDASRAQSDDNLIKNPGEAVIEETIAAISFEIDPQNRQRLHFLAAASEGDDAVTGDFDIDDECEYDFINIFEFDARNVYTIDANEGHTRATTSALIMPVTMVELQPNGEYATSNVPLNIAGYRITPVRLGDALLGFH